MPTYISITTHTIFNNKNVSLAPSLVLNENMVSKLISAKSKVTWRTVLNISSSLISAVKAEFKMKLTRKFSSMQHLYPIYTIQPVVWQQVVSCIQTFNRLSNRFDNRLYCVNGALESSTVQLSICTKTLPLKAICNGFSPNWWKVVSSCILQYKPICVINFDKLRHKMLKSRSLVVFVNV